MSGAAAAGAAAAAAMMNAVRAMGVVVKVEPETFLQVLERGTQGLVVYTPRTFLGTRHHYLVSYKGFAFYTKSPQELRLPPSVEIVKAKSIYIPG